MASPRGSLPDISIRFDRDEWRDEVERLDARSTSRIQAERARREIEGGKAVLDLQKCEADGEAGTSLPGCVKRHPSNPATRTVYERAHKRLHGRYP